MFDALSYSNFWLPRRSSAFKSECGFATGEPLTYGETVELARLLRICVKWKAEVRSESMNGNESQNESGQCEVKV